jgi:Cu2+-exporting ATPase
MTCCLLCNEKTSSATAIWEEDRLFCCRGCLAVFTILQKHPQASEASSFNSSPLYLAALRAKVISNPHLEEELGKRAAPGQTERLYLEISGMWCHSCAEVIRLILLQMKGVISCQIDYATDVATLAINPLAIGLGEITSAISALGYAAEQLTESINSSPRRSLWLRFAIATFCALNVMMLSYPLYATYLYPEEEGVDYLLAWLSFIFSLPVLSYAAYPIYRRAINGLFVGVLRMEALVSMSVFAACWLSLYALLQGSSLIFFDSATVVITLVLFGKILENRAKFSSKKTLMLLSRFIPKKCRKIDKEGIAQSVSIKEIALGDQIAIAIGEKIPLDSEVIAGEAAVDEALVTGEPMPIYKKIGDKLLAGSTMIQGSLIATATHLGEKNLLHQILHTAKESLREKQIYSRLVDAIVPKFVAIVLIIGIVALFCGSGIHALLATLMISCPCAIGIAAPMAESRLIHILAEKGIWIKNRGVISLIGKESVWVSDKTGTVTHGNFEILSGIDQLGVPEQQMLKALVQRSNHPIAIAVNKAIPISPETRLTDILEKPGKGMSGNFFEKLCLFGSKSFLEENGVEVKDVEQSSYSHVYFYFDNESYLLVLGDKIRKEAKEFFQSNSKSSILLSGDHRQATEKVADECGFNAFFAEQKPEKKFQFIKNLQEKGEIVCMVGDGINDAMALSAADIAISFVSAPDLSQNIADIVLAKEDWHLLTILQKQSFYTQKIIRQNIFWAFFYNCLGIPLAVLGLLSPLLAAIAMTASSLMILANTQRIRSAE